MRSAIPPTNHIQARRDHELGPSALNKVLLDANAIEPMSLLYKRILADPQLVR